MHVPVMLDEIVGLLVRGNASLFFDGTFGGGGHAEAILQAASPGAVLVGTDRDAEAIKRSSERLAGFGDRVRIWHATFEGMAEVLSKEGFDGVDGMILDIGYSSFQVDDAERGFSIKDDGPLDMRMDKSEGVTAEMMVNGYSQEELADVIYEFGEERASRRIARAIVRRRGEKPFSRTNDFADVVGRAAGGRRGRIHPATKTFQALRIAVNRELECLEEGLKQGVSLLNVGGRMAVMSFHSLEDRIVKRFFRGRATAEGEMGYEIITRRPMTASEDEVGANPRARSAKLRVIERSE